MTLTILVPLDGTEFGEAALPAAAKLADGAHARLLLFEAFPPADKAGRSDDAEAEVRGRALDYLGTVQGRIIRQYSLEQVYIEAEGSRAADGIVEAANKWNAGLIVMATHGHRALRGSVAENVMRHGKVPVALIRP